TIPVPKVLAMWEDETGDNVIIMEKIVGTTLMDSWHRMGRHQKRDVLEQICDHFTQMRNLTWPGYFGGVMDQRCLDVFVASCTYEGIWMDPGRMTTEDHWITGLFNSGSTLMQKEVPLDLQEALREEAAKENPGVFTHGDFHPGNVMVDDHGKVFLIDWERAGWAPGYWERALIMIGPAGIDNWADFTDEVSEILRDLRGGRPFSPPVQAIDFYYDWLQGQR
ncbi:phosphotransferase, partial [Candidatus Bathyarchaeota archaeon]|nr:phosphotransferase [Candidatus Bathyarchaeota archaeon]